MLLLVIVTTCFAAVFGRGLETLVTYQDDYTVNGEPVIEGDILARNNEERNAVGASKLWPNGVVPYVMQPNIEQYSWRIQAAFDYYETYTCIRFVERTNEKDYVLFQSNNEERCFSRVGRSGGPQPFSMYKDQCLNFGTLLHELGHTIGFFHEHTRSDRDEYIQVFWDNIDEKMKKNFVKQDPRKENLLGYFDYDSIMLYGEYTFSKDPARLKSMTPVEPGLGMRTVKDKGKLSEQDIVKIKTLYNCP